MSSFPLTLAVEWAWLTNLASREDQQSIVRRLIDDADSDDGHASTEGSPPSHSRDFYNFSMIAGRLTDERDAKSDPVIGPLIAFCAPLMCLDMSSAPQCKDLELGSDAYAVMAPATVEDMLARYARIHFSDLEPIYVEFVTRRANEWPEGDVSFARFVQYCEAWKTFLRVASVNRRGIVCAL